MDLFENYHIQINTLVMVFRAKYQINNVVFNDEIVQDLKPSFKNTVNVKIIHNNRIYRAKIGKTEIQICGIKDINNAHVIFNKLLAACNHDPISLNDLTIILINTSCKFPPISSLHYQTANKPKNCNLFVYPSGQTIISATSIQTTKEQYLHLYAQFLLPTILNILYNTNTSIFHYIPKELVDIICDYVIIIKDSTSYPIQEVKRVNYVNSLH